MNISILLNSVVEDADSDLSQLHIFGEIAKYRSSVIDAGGEVDLETENELLAFDLRATRSCDKRVWGSAFYEARVVGV